MHMMCGGDVPLSLDIPQIILIKNGVIFGYFDKILLYLASTEIFEFKNHKICSKSRCLWFVNSLSHKSYPVSSNSSCISTNCILDSGHALLLEALMAKSLPIESFPLIPFISFTYLREPQRLNTQVGICRMLYINDWRIFSIIFFICKYLFVFKKSQSNSHFHDSDKISAQTRERERVYCILVNCINKLWFFLKIFS